MDSLQRSLSVEQRDFGPVHASVADTLNELGNAASLRGDYAGAQERFQRVADIYRAIYGDQHYLVAIALSNVAYAKLNLEDYAGAEADALGQPQLARRHRIELAANQMTP